MVGQVVRQCALISLTLNTVNHLVQNIIIHSEIISGSEMLWLCGKDSYYIIMLIIWRTLTRCPVAHINFCGIAQGQALRLTKLHCAETLLSLVLQALYCTVDKVPQVHNIPGSSIWSHHIACTVLGKLGPGQLGPGQLGPTIRP